MLSDRERATILAEHCREDPHRFVVDVLGADPHPWQSEVLRALIEHDHIAIRAGHDVGKTALLSWSVLWYLTTRIPNKIVVAAASQDQLRDVDWAELRKWFGQLPIAVQQAFDFGTERISLKASPSECFAVARTASKATPESLQGFHSEHLFYVLEEASGIDDIVFEVASGALSSRGSRALMIGNPTRAQGYFSRAFKENRWLWRGYHWPWMPTKYNNHDYPEQMKREYGEHSNVYRVRVKGDFPTAEDSSVIPLEIIEAAIVRDVLPIMERGRVWGLDIARFGDDRCALVKRWGNTIEGAAKVWRQRDTMETVGLVAREWFETTEDKRPAAINADVIGVGAGVVDRLHELGLPVYGVNVGEVADDPQRFMRLRDSLWWAVRTWFFSLEVKIPDDPDLISDLVGPTYKILSTGKLQVESKEEMKKRGIKSPDIADALCLTFAGGEFAAQYARRDRAETGGYDILSAMDKQIGSSVWLHGTLDSMH